ncbi:MAG TPA: hypothetical protein VGM94_16830 [Galbitalea sp.]|jgi:hypothetical protein
MTNQMPFIPAAAARALGNDSTDDQTDLPVNDDHLDDGETNDSQATVEEDIREEDDVNENIEK